jgi:alpha-1,3-rhamnosyl/mannosyltransferase
MQIAFDARAASKPPHSFRRVLRLLIDAARERDWGVELWHDAPLQPEFAALGLRGRHPAEAATSSAAVLWSPQMDIWAADRPSVATIHDVNPLLEDQRNPFSRWRRRRKFRRLLNAADSQVRVYATDSVDAQRRITGFFPHLAGRIGVVPLYVESSLRPPTAADAMSVLAGLGLCPGYFLFVGSLRRHKNWHGLLEAYARLPAGLRAAHPLVYAGSDHRAGSAARRLAARLGVADQVHFTGPVADAALPALYTGALAFVFPSFLEGFGLPPLEAMALGVPVVASPRTSLPEVLGDAPLYAEPDDLSALADALRRVAEDSDLRTRLAAAGPPQAARFSPARTADAMAALLAHPSLQNPR